MSADNQVEVKISQNHVDVVVSQNLNYPDLKTAYSETLKQQVRRRILCMGVCWLGIGSVIEGAALMADASPKHDLGEGILGFQTAVLGFSLIAVSLPRITDSIIESYDALEKISDEIKKNKSS